MKKVLLILLSIGLILSMVGAVAGETTTYEQTISGDGNNAATDLGGSKTAEVTYSIHNTYVVKVPSKFVFSKATVEDEDALTAGSSIFAKITTIGPNEYLNVTMEGSHDQNSEGKWYLQSDADNNDLYEYYVKISDSSTDHIDLNQPTGLLTSGEVAVSIPSGDTNEHIKHVHMRLLTIPTAAAEYTDTITFRVTIGQ